METKLRFKYDREADILHIDQCPPYAEQESEELADEVVARLNPKTGEVENLEILFFSTRLLRTDLLGIASHRQSTARGQGGHLTRRRWRRHSCLRSGRMLLKTGGRQECLPH